MTGPRSVTCLLSLITFLLWAPLALAVHATGLKAGVARIDITPDKPVTMSGYDARTGLSTGVHDPLSARVLAFEAGGKRLVLVSTDLIGFYSGTADHMRQALLREFGLQPSELFLTAIHDHAGPALTIDPQRGHAHNLEYTEKLKSKLIEVVRQALGGMEPVRVGLGVGSCPMGVNRRELRVNNRVAGLAEEVVGAVAADQDVVAGAAVEEVIAGMRRSRRASRRGCGGGAVAVEGVVAGQSGEGVVAGAADEDVGLGASR